MVLSGFALFAAVSPGAGTLEAARICHPPGLVTAPPLPASPCVRCRLVYETPSAGEGGSRFYLSYSGSAPSGANCSALAGDIESAWASHMAPVTAALWSLNEVDVLDIATDSGLSGQWTGNTAGTRTGPSPPEQVAANIEFGISRRYRGGKPRMFLPPGTSADINNENMWSGSFLTAVNSAFGAFISQIEGLSIGSMGTLQHVNLSYYKGFTNITNSSGRTRAVPTYRSSALLDTITGYSAKAVLGSQRRRRTSTTP